MFGPDFDEYVKPIIDIYQKVENDLLIKIASHFRLYEDIGFENSMKWYAKKLAEQGGLTQEAINIISKQTKIPKSKIIKMLKDAGISTLDLEEISKVNEETDFKINVDKLINSESFNHILNNSYKEIDKIFKMINTKAIESASEVYMDILNEAYIAVQSGDKDYSSAIRKALQQMADNGIKVASYKQKNGKIINYGIESCVRRDVLTAVVQCTNKASDDFIEQMHAEYVEISQHLGARDTETHDYKDHSWWQGKVYKINGSTEEYPNFQDTCNEGDIQGFSGVNCRHVKRAFWPGISVPKNIDINSKENKKVYELSKQQRSYENKIKRYKRHMEVAKASNDNEYYSLYKEKFNTVNKEYNDWLKENNLKRDYNREYIAKNNIIFEDNPIIDDFKGLDNKVEHLMIYDINTDKKLLQVSSGNRSNVGSLKAVTLIKTSKPNSLVAVHNHPSNSSFSFTDMETFNNNKSLDLIVVKTDKYLYYLEKNGISKVKMNQLKKFYNSLYQKNVKIYGKNIETRHITNKVFAKEIGWRYGRKKY